MPGYRKLVGKHLEMALKTLKIVTRFLDGENIPYILDKGTLLGIIRENRLLPWDSDMDIHVSRDHLPIFLKTKWKLWFKGYRVKVKRYREDVGPFKKGEVRIIKIQTRKFLFFKEGNIMDLFVKKQVGDEHIYTVGQYPFYLKSVPSKFFYETTDIEFDGKKYPIPKEFDEYLRYYYGDWKIPVEDWNFKTSDGCLKEVIDVKKNRSYNRK